MINVTYMVFTNVYIRIARIKVNFYTNKVSTNIKNSIILNFSSAILVSFLQTNIRSTTTDSFLTIKRPSLVAKMLLFSRRRILINLRRSVILLKIRTPLLFFLWRRTFTKSHWVGGKGYFFLLWISQGIWFLLAYQQHSIFLYL